MIRPATLAAIALGFLTALVLGQVGQTLVASRVVAPRIDESDDSGARKVVHEFYSDINRLLASGDTAIESRITSDFVDHQIDTQVDHDIVALIDELNAVRPLEPSLQLQVIETLVDGAMVSVELRDSAEAHVTVSGLAVSVPEREHYWETLRIEDDRVAERWSQGDAWPRVALSVETPVTLLLPQSLIPAIQRLVLQPETEIELTAQVTVILLVESGTLIASIDGRDLEGTPQAAAVPIATGDVRLLDEVPGRLRLRNPDSIPAIVWTFSLTGIHPPAAINQRLAKQSAGFEEETRAFVAAELPAGDMLLTATWVTLPAGAVIEAHRPGVFETVAVLNGALDCHLFNGNAYVMVDFGQMIALPGAAIASAGQGFGVTSDGELEYRVDGLEPATIVLMTLSAP